MFLCWKGNLLTELILAKNKMQTMQCATAELYEFLKENSEIKKMCCLIIRQILDHLRTWYAKHAESIKLILYYIE